ncbi:hypothetical protein [Chondrinema litorale]|uniref:hypothetical protein n=1 Tax=Chondrinema litorale TaxID=2994555 RepID=UPI00254282B3|nr:hypothetical protein [Chondrinema litorale]UZS00318.1 hypothetical protein OQ292_40945 [Chondrinema litorale]
MSKKKTVDSDFDNLIGTNMPTFGDVDDMLDMQNESDNSTMPTPKVIKAKKKRNKRNSKYSPFRMRTEILEQMEEIADKEKVAFPGQLVHIVLQNYIDWYKNNKK